LGSGGRCGLKFTIRSQADARWHGVNARCRDRRGHWHEVIDRRHRRQVERHETKARRHDPKARWHGNPGGSRLNFESTTGETHTNSVNKLVK
jgi:hypothetical protein